MAAQGGGTVKNLSVQEWVNKIDHNMNSLCQPGRGAHIRYSANLNLFFFSDNGLAPGQRQAIIWTNAGIL